MDTSEALASIEQAMESIASFKKTAFQPMPPPPQDPAMMQGGPPMDPAMMQGAPMDPSMMQGAPMDPAMMQGGPPMDPAMMQGGGAPPSPEVEGALTQLMTAMEKAVGVLEQHKTTISELKGQLDKTREESIAQQVRIDMLEKSLTGGDAYNPGSDPNTPPPQMPLTPEQMLGSAGV